MLKFVSAFALVFLFTTSVSAEEQLWRCRKEGSPNYTFTNSPVVGNNNCVLETFSQGAFNRVSTEQFARLSGLEPISVSELVKENKKGKKRGKSPEKTKTKKQSKHPKKTPAAKPKQTKQPEVAWEFEEIKDKNKKDKDKTFNSRCHLSGTAAGDGPVSSMVVIRRGGATVDEVPVQLKANFKAVKWNAELTGTCRKPAVSLR